MRKIRRNISYSPNYYSITDILATDEKVPYEKTHVLSMLEQKSGCSTTDESGNISLAPLNVSTTITGPTEGTENTPSNISALNDLRQNDGQKELPYWMIKDAEDLHNYYLAIKVPEIYKATTKSICHAGATSIDLSKLSKNFYEFGMHMSTLDDDNVIGTLLLDMARQRLAGLFNACNYTEGDGRKEQNFENHEKKLFEIGCENFENFHSWLIRDTSAQKPKSQKRKRSAMMET